MALPPSFFSEKLNFDSNWSPKYLHQYLYESKCLSLDFENINDFMWAIDERYGKRDVSGWYLSAVVELPGVLNKKGQRLLNALASDVVDCPACGSKVKFKQDVYCDECGAVLGDVRDYLFPDKYCRCCGSNVQIGKKFCCSCNVKLAFYTSCLTVCGGCGESIDFFGYIYCTHCGNKLR